MLHYIQFHLNSVTIALIPSQISGDQYYTFLAQKYIKPYDISYHSLCIPEMQINRG